MLISRAHRSGGPFIAFLFLVAAAPAHPQLTEPSTVRIGVFSLFHPKTLILTSSRPLTLTLDTQTLTLPANRQLTLDADPDGLIVHVPDQADLTGNALAVENDTFTLTVPGKLTRLYRGGLSIAAHDGVLAAIVAMPTEVAVASIVQAEAPPRASIEALKAQAIVSRSLLLAQTHAHPDFDACDTTHCQFLRSPPPAGSPASIAAHATRGQVLTWRSSPESQPRIVAAMYSRSCGGRTHAHPTSPGAYPFYSVRCEFCLRHPELWYRPAPSELPHTEQQRLAYNRTHGWSAVPSGNYSVSAGAMSGRGIGHGVGLCQVGAADLAARGASYQEILAHFFPNTTIWQPE